MQTVEELEQHHQPVLEVLHLVVQQMLVAVMVQLVFQLVQVIQAATQVGHPEVVVVDLEMTKAVTVVEVVHHITQVEAVQVVETMVEALLMVEVLD